MYSFVIALLLVSIHALTPVPTTDGSISLAPTMRPTATPGDDSVLTPVPTTDGQTVPTPHPTSFLLSPSPTTTSINGALSRCIATDTPLDIIFMVDSSGSVWDEGYKNWENELDLVYDIIDNAIPSNSRVGLINFSGCGFGYSVEDCQNQNRLKQMISLTDNGSPNDLDAVLSIVDAIDEDDFNGGYTWTNEALAMALDEFNSNSEADTNKMIVLISDGEPYPHDQGHEPCKVSTDYTSPTLLSLQALGVSIITVAIDISVQIKEEYFDCISSADFYFEATFDPSPSSVSSPTMLPSPGPTPAPVQGSGLSPAPTQIAHQASSTDAGSQAVGSGSSPTPPPTLDGSLSLAPTMKPTATPGDGSILSPAPTSNVAPGTVPTPPPTLDGLSPVPTMDLGLSQAPTPAPVSSPGTPPTLSYAPTSYPLVAVEDLSDSIGDFICAELGSSRLIVPTNKPTPSPTYMIEPSPKPTTEPTLGNLQGQCSSTNELDIIFMVDSSGSVYDDGYINWQSELDLVYDIVGSLSDSSRVSLINFSGCGASYSLTQCKEQGRLNTVFDFDTYNNLESVSDRIGAMDSDDFNGGYTWTNEALGLALDQFNTNSDGDKTKIIVLLTDGEPYPYDDGHEPCLTSTDYKSPILTSLDTLNVDIITVGIDISSEIKEEKLDCVSSSYFGVSHFSTLESLSVQIGELICDRIDGDFTTMSLAPSMRPTASPYTTVPTPRPVANPSLSTVPTPSPVTVHAISNGIMASIYINLAIISGLIGYVLLF